MNKTNIYEVAGHRFGITADEILLRQLTSYEPFIIAGTTDKGLLFEVKVVSREEFPSIVGMTKEIMQDEDYVKMLIGHWGDRSYFEFILYDNCEGRMLVSADYSEAIVTTKDGKPYAVNNAAMLMYTLTTASLGTALFHASVVEHKGKAYMFLGKSGTGKSTHARLWLQHIADTHLVNDDNPVARTFADGSVVVYGSPWSGKTPCYRNVSYPIGGIVRLEQAPENNILRLGVIDAYAAILPSIAGKRWNKDMANGLHQTESALIQAVPIWYLECRPDRDAATLCFKSIKI